MLDLEKKSKILKDQTSTTRYNEYVGKGYGKVTQEGLNAIRLIAEKEGIFLDPVYTGKGMSGLIDHIREDKVKKGEKVIWVLAIFLAKSSYDIFWEKQRNIYSFSLKYRIVQEIRDFHNHQELCQGENTSLCLI